MPARLPDGMVDDQRTSSRDQYSPVADYIIAGSDTSRDIQEMCDLVLDGVTDGAKLQLLIDEIEGKGKIIIVGSFVSEVAITYASPYLHIAGFGVGISTITAGAAHDVFSFSGAGRVIFSGIEVDGDATGLKGIETTAAGVVVSIRDCKIHSHATNDVDINGTTYDDVYNLDSVGTYSRFEYEGGVKRRETTTAVDYFTIPTDDLITCTTGGFTVTLMDHSFEFFEVKTICDRDGSAGGANITIATDAGATINGAASITLAAAYDSVDIIKLGDSNYRVV